MYASPLNELIETLVESIQKDSAAIRERHLLRQALHALVRQAQVEQAHARPTSLRVGGPDGFWHKAPQQACHH